MDTNQAADSWAMAQDEAKRIAATLEAGDYWYRWDDYDDGDEADDQITDELCRELGKHGLALYSDDLGMRVVEVVR